jgi:hypothetical protein
MQGLFVYLCMQVGLPVSWVVSFPLSLLTCVLHTLSLQVRGLERDVVYLG